MKWDHDNPGPFDGEAQALRSTYNVTNYSGVLRSTRPWRAALVAAAATGLMLVTVLAYDVATVLGTGFLFLGVCYWSKP